MLNKPSRRIAYVILAALVVFVFMCTVATASINEPPARTIKRLQAENAKLRRQNAALNTKIVTLFAQINQLYSDITDCVSKIPPPIGP